MLVRVGRFIGRGGGNFVATPRIQLSGTTIAEDAAGDTVIGTLSVANGSGSYTFSITADPDSKFQIINDDELALGTEATLDYETATSHLVTIEADNGVDDPISRQFTISVTNVLEVTLNELSLDADEITENSAEDTVIGAVVGKSSGSTLSLIDDAGGRFKLSGTNIVAGATNTDYEAATSYNITLRETHPDASNSPNDTVIPITVVDDPDDTDTVPAAFEVGDWSIAAGDEQADVTISSLPADGGDTITDIEYRVDGGSPVSSGTDDTTGFTIPSLTNDQEYDVEIRAVNSVGAGTWSDVKQVTPEDVATGSLAQQDLGASSGLALSFLDDFFYATTALYGSAFVSSPAYDAAPFGLLTYTSPSPKLLVQSGGLVQYADHNLLTQSEDFTTWTNQQTTETANATTAPDGTNTGTKLIGTASTNEKGIRGSFSYVAGFTYRASVYAKAAEYDYIALNCYDGASDFGAAWKISDASFVGYRSGGGSEISQTVESIGSGWIRVSLTFTAGNSASTYMEIKLQTSTSNPAAQSVAGDGTSGVYIWGAQLCRAPVSANRYIKTTGSAKYDIPFEWNGAGSLLGARVEGASTNLCLRSDDLTNASWSKTNMTAAKTADGVGGLANGATTLTATAGNATVLQAITSGSAQRVTSCWIKRRTGSGTVEMTQDNGSTWTAVTVTAGWTRVAIAAATLANPTVGLRIVTSGDEVDVQLFQHELGAAPSSPIQTIGSSVTRAADTIGPPLANFPWNSGSGTYTVDGMSESPTNNGSILTLAARSGETHIESVKWTVP